MRHSEQRWLVAVLLAALLLRGLTAAVGPDHFQDDRDAYLALAQGLAEGRGFSVQGTTIPTAYRPPLYPLLIAPVSSATEFGAVGRAVLHIGLAVSMVWLVWQTGVSLGLSVRGRLVAATLLAVDPVLILYANFPMTETLCAMLGAWLLLCCVKRVWTVRSAFVTGLIWGLCVLARPTFWVAGGLMLIGAWLPLWASADRRDRSFQWPLATGLGVLALVAPWGIRNWVKLGHPVFMTTHGGYTLLLGNNEDFYDQVTRHSWSTVWEGEGQQRWANRMNHELDSRGLWNEVDRDIWLKQQAQAAIQSHPWLFAKATASRLIQFWQIVPGGESVRGLPAWLLGGIALFYLGYWCLVLCGAVQSLREREWRWLPLVLLPLAFTCVHAVYWSNMRMRAPVLPAVALIAARGLERRRGPAT